jgi:hypothetical protein
VLSLSPLSRNTTTPATTTVCALLRLYLHFPLLLRVLFLLCFLSREVKLWSVGV